MSVSILLVNYNMSPMFEKFLPKLIEQIEKKTKYEIIILDNSDDPEFTLTKNFSDINKNIKLIYSQNEGFVAGLNKIISLVRYHYVIIMHPDVELLPGTLNKLQTFLDENQYVGIVAPNLYYPNGIENKIRLKFPTIISEIRRIFCILLNSISRRIIFQREQIWDHKSNVKVDMVMSVFMLLRKELLHEVSPICNSLWTYYSNDYICSEAGKNGWEFWYLSDAKAIHYERYTDESLYSSTNNSEYKKTPIPINGRMEKDNLTFLSTRYNFVYWHTLRGLLIIEYLLHTFFTALKGEKEIRNEMIKVIKKLWSVKYDASNFNKL